MMQRTPMRRKIRTRARRRYKKDKSREMSDAAG